MSLSLNPIISGSTATRAEFKTTSPIAVTDKETIKAEMIDICDQANAELDVFGEIIARNAASSAFLAEVSKFVKGEQKSSEETKKADDEEVAQAKKAANSLFKICALMQKLNDILTTLRIHNADMYQDLKEPQEASYLAQKDSYVKKAWFALAGGTLGGLCKATSPMFGDVGKAIMEGISNVFPSVGNFFGTLEDGNISGENAHEIKVVENAMGQDRDHIAQAQQTAQAFWQQLETILRELAQTGDISARTS